MSVELDFGPPRDEGEVRALAEVLLQSLSASPPQEEGWFEPWRARWGEGVDFRLVRREGRVAAGLAILRMPQFFGGVPVPSAAITAVGVAPEHRGEGLAAAMMQRVVRDLSDEGIPLSALYPASQRLYRKAGYEQAGAYLTYRLASGALPERRDRDLEARPIEAADHPKLVQLHEERARRSPGTFRRNAWLWSRVMKTPGAKTFGYLFEEKGEPEGYMVFHHKEEPTIRYDLHLKDLVARTPRAHARLLSFLRGHASMAAHVFFQGAPADPYLTLLEEQDHFAIQKRIVWVERIIDAAKALTLRGYLRAVTAELHFEVSDELLPANARPFTLHVKGGKGEVEPGGRGEIKLDIRAFASLYTGYLSPFDLARAGLMTGPDDALADALAAFAGPAPWMPDMF